MDSTLKKLKDTCRTYDEKYTPPSTFKAFKQYAILLNEDDTNQTNSSCMSTLLNRESMENKSRSDEQVIDHYKEDMIYKLGRLLKAKIQVHSEHVAEVFTAAEALDTINPNLVAIMYRLAVEGFVRKSTSMFKIIECRNGTKLTSDWNPSLIDILISLGHQVILVELKDFPNYTDFAYSILRQLNYIWKNNLPKSFFHPEDVCTVHNASEYPNQQVVIVSPLMMPDGEMDLSNRFQDNLTYEILMMLKESCVSGLKNHLLKRDLHVGTFEDTTSGVNSIRHVYRSLQRKLKERGENIEIGHTSVDIHEFLLSVAGDSLSAAEAHIMFCKNPNNTSIQIPEKVDGAGGDVIIATTDEQDIKKVYENNNNCGDINPNEADSGNKNNFDNNNDILEEVLKAVEVIRQNFDSDHLSVNGNSDDGDGDDDDDDDEDETLDQNNYRNLEDLDFNHNHTEYNPTIDYGYS